MNKAPSVLIQGTPCVLQFGTYRNGTLALQANTEETSEPYCVLTVNYEDLWEGGIPYAKIFKAPVVVIKNYSENEGMLQDLVAAKVITRGAYLSGSNGGVEACQLTPEWEAIAKTQLKEQSQAQRA